MYEFFEYLFDRYKTLERGRKGATKRAWPLGRGDKRARDVWASHVENFLELGTLPEVKDDEENSSGLFWSFLLVTNDR